MIRTLLTAHFGCDGTKENSMEHVACAFSHSVDCIEADIRKNNEVYLELDVWTLAKQMRADKQIVFLASCRKGT